MRAWASSFIGGSCDSSDGAFSIVLALICGGLFDVVDDEYWGRSLGGVELQAELLLHCRRERGRCVGIFGRGRLEAAHGFELRFVGSPVQVEVVAGGEAGVVDDGLVHD